MSADGDAVVEIPQGRLLGSREASLFGEEFFAFRGIPYAKPPVGELRFKAPQPANGWTGVRDARSEGKFCPSTDFHTSTYLEGGDEDCLFVNVYCRQSPKDAAGTTPVLVFIHGGGFEFGSGNAVVCGPDYFMLHDVVLVTFNYRLGALGFLSLQTVDCPGNFGLKDQQLALRWVKSNVAHFGGDPDNVTVFGISAGGASVQYQTLAPGNEGLFKRAVAQSGSVLNRWAYANSPRENAFLLGKRLGCDTRDDRVLLEFLKRVPAEDLVVKAQGIVHETEGVHPGDDFLKFTFVPTREPSHEGAFLTEHPWELLKKGRYLDVPFLTGICRKEMIISLRGPDDYPRLAEVREFQALIPKDIRFERDTERTLSLARRLKDLYFENGANVDGYVDVLSDTSFIYGVYKGVRRRTANAALKSPTYVYEFAYEGNQSLFGLRGPVKGASHGEDTCYLFRMYGTDAAAMMPGERDHEMMRRFTALWVSFAATGTPACGDFLWEETRSEDVEYLSLGESLEMKRGLLRERMALWDEVYSAYYDGR